VISSTENQARLFIHRLLSYPPAPAHVRQHEGWEVFVDGADEGATNWKRCGSTSQ
jgi:hypothetical protein